MVVSLPELLIVILRHGGDVAVAKIICSRFLPIRTLSAARFQIIHKFTTNDRNFALFSVGIYRPEILWASIFESARISQKFGILLAYHIGIGRNIFL